MGYRVVVAGLAVVVSGCFTVPAAPGKALPLDAKLLGEWDCAPLEASSLDKAKLTIVRFDDSQYYAEWKEDAKVERYRTYPVKLRGIVVLNVKEVTNSSSRTPWVAVRPSFESDGSLTLGLPAKRIMDMSDETAALRELRSTADSQSAWQLFARCSPIR